ncbi:hypothetical protein D3C72_66460 [compost metagenome]
MGGLFTLLFKFFVRFFSIEKAFRISGMLAMMALATGLYLAMKSCAEGVCGAAIQNISVSHPSFAVGLGLGFNSITYTSVACYISVWTLCQMYVIKKRMITMAG